MNFSTNWRDKRTTFRPTHYSIANYSTETKKDMRTAFGEDLFLNNLHLIPDPLLKNLADTIITEEKMAPKSKLDNNISMKTNEDMLNEPDYSPLSGITSFFAGVMSVISNAMFSKRKQEDFGAEPGGQMAVPPMWHGAKLLDENKIFLDENNLNDMSSERLASEMTDCRTAAAHCQNKIEQVRLLLSSTPVPCNIRTRRRPKKVFVEASSVEDSFEDAFSPEDFENIANDSYIEYHSPVCYQDHIFHEVDGPKVKTETAKSPETILETPPISEPTEIVKDVPEIDTANDNKLDCDTKHELVASCEDKLNKLKALLQDRKKKPRSTIETKPVSVPEQNVPAKPKTASKVKDKRFKNRNRLCGKRMKSKMRRNIQDDLQFANDINSEELSSVENSPSICNLEKCITKPIQLENEYFDEVCGRFHPASVTESEDSFQIVFNDSPRLRRASDCDSEDSFIVFEDSPDSCYTSNDVFGDTSDSEDYDSDSDYSDSGCGNMSFKLAASLSKSVCNLADDSLYVEGSEDEVDCANVRDVAVSENVSVGDLLLDDLKTGLLIDDRKKLLRKQLPAKRVQFSQQPPKVHVMRVWSFAARQARAGHWERYAIDRERFKRRIADVEVAVSWVLKPQHRSRVMFQRFMPWWNAQKRKELAEKKEREAQKKLREEKLKEADLEELASKKDITEVGDNTVSTNNGQLNNPEERKTEVVTEDVKNDLRNSKSGKEDKTNQVNEKNTKKNEKEIDLNREENITQNNSKESTGNEINNISYKNGVTQNRAIISFNDKVLDLNTDLVSKSILDT